MTVGHRLPCIASCVAALALACTELPPLPDRMDAAATDTDADTDADSDADADADADADSDADTESESDTDPLDCAGGRLDEVTGLCWQHPASSGTYEWLDAIDYCTGLVKAEHDDWTLPDRFELTGLLDGCAAEVLDGGEGECDTCAQSEPCNSLFGDDEGMYWSSTEYEPDTDRAWTVRFDGSGVLPLDKGGPLVVRCVHTEP
jgi:hypothetical protein